LNFAGKSGSTGSGLFSASHIGAVELPHHGHADAITVSDPYLLFSGDYKRSGPDLILSKDGREHVVENYFVGEKRAALAAPDGAQLSGEVVSALTGHVQYAQASGAVDAGKVIGHVTKLSGNATVIRNGVSIVLNMGDNVHKGDVVQSGSNSSLGITFIDGTVFGLASNARMVLNEMVYDPNGTSNSSFLTLVQGTITFVAGQTAKHGDMKVDTPVATMGIRGTACLVEMGFDVPLFDPTNPALNLSIPVKFHVLREADGSVGSYLLFAKTDLTYSSPIATINRVGEVTAFSANGQITNYQLTLIAPEVKALIDQTLKLYFPNYNPTPQIPGSTPANPLTPDNGNKQPINFQTDKPTDVPLDFIFPNPNHPGETFRINEVTITRHNTEPTVTVNPVADKSNFQIKDQVVITDPDSPDDVPHPYVTGSGKVVSATGPAYTPAALDLARLINLDPATGAVSYNPESFAFLKAGDKVIVTIAFDANSGPDTVHQTLTLTIDGVNDAPTVASAVTGGGAEGSGAAAVNLLNFASDADSGAALHVANLVRTDPGGGLPGSFALSPDGNSISVDTDSLVYNSLAQGETFTAHFGYDVVDENGASVHQTAAVTIVGTNDAPVFTTGPAITQLSVPANGVPFSHGEKFAFGPDMSSDGRFVVFGASNQIPGQNDSSRLGDVYLYDRLTGTYKWISDPLSFANSGITPHAGETYDGLAAISLDGQFVTFRGQFQVTQIIGGQPVTFIQSETFLYNTSTGVTTLVPGLNGDEPSINANGSLIAATGQSLTAPSGNTFIYNDVLVTDRLGHVVTRISGDTNASPVNTADISPDGRYVTFWSTASQIEVKNIKPGGGPVDSLTFNVGATWPAGPSTPAGPVAQVYVFDRQTETINLVSVSPTGQMGNGNSSVLTLQTSAGFIDIGDDWKSQFSADGRFIIFQSNASNLVAGDNNGATDVFLYDLQTHQVQLVSVAADGSSANGNSYRPAISSDGHHIVFASNATNLLGASNTPAGASGFQTYIREFDPATGLLSTGFSGFHNGDNQYGDSISRDGGIVAFGGAALAFNANQGQAEFISVAAGTVKFSGGSISDYNPAADTLTVTVSVAHGTLSPVVAIVPGSGLTIVGGFNGSQGILKFTGSIDAINHALDSGVIYTPTAGGPDAIAMTVTDGHGGTAAHTVQFDSGAPQITGVSMIGNTIAFDHDQPQALLLAQGQVKFFNDSISDSTPGFNQNADALTVTVSVGHGTLTPVGLGSGVTIVGGFDGHAGTLKFTGTIAAVNHALESGAVYAATSGGPDTITVTVTDGHGGTATQSTQFNPQAPAIDGELVDGQYEIFVVDRAGGTAGLVIEDSSLTAPNSGTLLTKGAFGFTDPDLSDTHTATVIGSPVVDASHAPGFVVPAGGLGTFTPLAVTESAGSGQVPWSFTVDNALVQSLGKGQYITQTYTVQLDDHHGGHPTQNVTVTIAGINDAPVVTNAALTVVGGGTVVLGASNIGISDPDSMSFTLTVSGVTHGSFQTTIDGTVWAAATTFTTADLTAGHVRFVHDGGNDAPTFSIQADDGAGSNSLSAVVAGGVSFSHPQFALTVNSDIFTGDPAGPRLITGNAATLTSGDSLMGAGHDVLALSGSGIFDLNAIAGYSGIERVNAVNFSGGFAFVTLRAGTTTDVATALGSGPATLNVSGATVNNIQGNWTNVVLSNATVGDINSGSATNIALSGGTTVGSIEGNWSGVGLIGTSRVTGAIQGNGDGNEISFYTLASWNPHGVIDGGGGFDTLNLLDFLNPAQNATLDLRSATLTSIERLNLNGSNNTLLVDTDALAGFTEIIGSVGSRIVTSEAALDLSGKTIFGGLTVQSSNATGTTFTVDSKPTAFEVYGGSGQDTLKTTSFAFTSTERDAVFATSSVETIVDTSGTHTAPADPNVYRLTPGTDTLTLTAADETINGNAVTFNAADNLNAGGGTDTLALYGSGSFDLNAIAGYSGVERVNAVNFSSGFAFVTLRAGTTTDVAAASGSGPATLNVSGATVNNIQGNWTNVVLTNATVGDINSGSATNIALSHGSTVGSIEGNWSSVGLTDTSRVTGAIQGNGDGNSISFETLASWNPHGVIDGGGGSDTLSLLGSFTTVQNTTLDLRSATLTGIEWLRLDGVNNTLLVDTDALADVTSIIGSVGNRIVTSEAALDLSGKTVSFMTVQSSNATGTTFTVDTKATAFQVYGGSGQDTLKTTSFAFTSTERDAVFATSSVETIIDQSGTYHSANYDAAPVITHAALTISQSHTVTLTTADIDFVDPDNSVITYTASNLSHGHFEIGIGNAADVTTTFISADVAAGLVSFVDDGSSGAPTFSLTPNDGSIDGATVNGVVTFSAANYTMSSSEGVVINVTPEGATSGFVFPGAGNVTTPGIPEDRIAIGYDVVGGGHVVLDNAPLLGVHQMASLSSETHSSGGTTFVSTTLDAGHGVTLVQTLALASDANFFTTTIDITNNGTADISNLRFLRNFDPDQDVQAHNDYNTFNDVVQNPNGTETFAILSATGVESHTKVAMIGLGAEWRASVFGFTNTDPYATHAFDVPTDPNGTKADLSLSLTSSLGTLTHGGGHVEVTYITTNNVATAGSNALFGTDSADTINGLGGDDLLIGLGGADTFVFNAASGGSGHDTIADFTPGADKISLDYHAFDAAGPNDFANWLATHATDSGGNALIDLNVDGLHPGVDTILLKNVATASLQASDFHTL
jgi:VCBS repeat-containing protein